MLLRCEWGLLTSEPRAVDACVDFGEAFPEHPSVRTLTYAAGRLAEIELRDDVLAESVYSRAALASSYTGLPATDALLARARVRARLGNREGALADLTLYANATGRRAEGPAVTEILKLLKLTPP
jgi:hypothetical protein